MPSGMSTDVVNAVLDNLIGASKGTILADSLDLDLLTTAPSDDDGTDAVSWGQGATTVDMTDSGIWAAASDRTKTATITSATNSSGDVITVVAFAWYDGSTYVGGAPLDPLDINDGESTDITVTLAGPSPS